MQSRLTLVILSATIVMCGIVKGDAQEAPAMRVGINVTTSTADPWYAADTGIFSRLGLKVTIQTLSGGAAIAAAIVSGDLDVGSSNMLWETRLRAASPSRRWPRVISSTTRSRHRVSWSHRTARSARPKTLTGRSFAGSRLGASINSHCRHGSIRMAATQARPSSWSCRQLQRSRRWSRTEWPRVRSAIRTRPMLSLAAGCARLVQRTVASRRASC